jgi:hypothetical protein
LASSPDICFPAVRSRSLATGGAKQTTATHKPVFTHPPIRFSAGCVNAYVLQKPIFNVSYGNIKNEGRIIMENKRANCIIEVSVDGANGRHAVGIMNMRQALDLPEMPSLSYTHPDPVKAAAGIVVSRQELAGFMACH